MSPKLRLLFDTCCSKKLAKEFRAFSDPEEREVQHLLDDWAADTPDSEWLASIKHEPGWIVITKDSGVNSRTEKLPLICADWGITHVTLTPAIIHAGVVVQKDALAAVWHQFPYLLRLTPGTRVKLGQARRRGGLVSYEFRVRGRGLATALKNCG